MNEQTMSWICPCDQFHLCLSNELRLLHLLFILPRLCLPVRLIRTRPPLRRVPLLTSSSRQDRDCILGMIHPSDTTRGRRDTEEGESLRSGRGWGKQQCPFMSHLAFVQARSAQGSIFTIVLAEREHLWLRYGSSHTYRMLEPCVCAWLVFIDLSISAESLQRPGSLWAKQMSEPLEDFPIVPPQMEEDRRICSKQSMTERSSLTRTLAAVSASLFTSSSGVKGQLISTGALTKGWINSERRKPPNKFRHRSRHGHWSERPAASAPVSSAATDK